MDRYDNIATAVISSANGSFVIGVPTNPVANQAYFVPDTGAFDGLATVPVADEQFETDNTVFRAQIGKIQLAPRILMITGKIITPKITVAETAFTNRLAFLRKMHATLAAPQAQGGLNLDIGLSTPAKAYKLFCHLHGQEALRIQKYADHYNVALALAAEDPLLYGAATMQITTVTNSGDVPEFAKIELPNCSNVTAYKCTDSAGHETTVSFREAVTAEVVAINVAYPGQICSISGTSIDNIDISNGKQAFIPVPVGTSTWTRNDSGDVKVYPRSPVIGVSP